MEGAEGTLMFAEAAEAAQVAERQLDGLGEVMDRLGQRLRELDPPVVITCARGSSDHAATFAKYLIETRVRRIGARGARCRSVRGFHGQ
jgi:glucosamine--fructose-6-phosphate aminotransferase (isomerizing)